MSEYYLQHQFLSNLVYNYITSSSSSWKGVLGCRFSSRSFEFPVSAIPATQSDFWCQLLKLQRSYESTMPATKTACRIRDLPFPDS